MIEGTAFTVIVVLFEMLGCFTDAAVNCADPVTLGVNVNVLPVGMLAGQAAPVHVQLTPLFVESLVTVAVILADCPRSIPSELGDNATPIDDPPPQLAKTIATKSTRQTHTPRITRIVDSLL